MGVHAIALNGTLACAHHKHLDYTHVAVKYTYISNRKMSQSSVQDSNNSRTLDIDKYN